MKKVAILIPVFNNLKFTQQCLNDLEGGFKKNPPQHFNPVIIVIDDGSSDGTAEWISQNKPDVELLKGDGNLWWSGGINVGAKHAVDKLRVDFLLLWNNDIMIEPGYFSRLDEIIAGLPAGTIVGSKIYKSFEQKILWGYGGYFNPRTGQKFMYGLEKKDGDEFAVRKEVDWLPGMGTLVPVEVVRKIGYWDDVNFPQYHGDSDFTYRAKLAGFSVVVSPELQLWNDTTNTGLRHQGSFKGLIRMFRDIKSNQNISKNLIFYRKYTTSRRAYLPLIRSYLRTIGGFLKWKVLGAFNIKKMS